MRLDKRGSVTVYVSLLFLVFLLLLSMCLEGAYLYLGKGKASGAYLASLSSTRGNYQKELEQKYHLFGLDVRYAAQLDEQIGETLNYGLTAGRDPFIFHTGSTEISKKVSLADRQGEILKKQIEDFMKYDLGKDGINALKEYVLKLPEGGDASQAKQVIDRANEQDTDENEQSQKQESTKPAEKAKDPRKGLTRLLREGTVSIVLGKDADVSKQEVPVVYGGGGKQKEKKLNFFRAESVSESLDEQIKETAKTGIRTELMSIAYASKYFHSYTSKEKKKGLQYEIEYLIAGNSSEKENLGAVFSKILLLRFLPNLIYVQKDPSKQTQAEALAAAVLGITGLTPAVKLVKELLLAALAYGESVIDIRNLAEGKKIPMWKSKDTWQMEFSGLASLSAGRKPVKQGLSYTDYLCLLLAVQTKKQEKYLRMMDLIEANIKMEVPEFSMRACYVSFQAETEMILEPFHFGGVSLPVKNKYHWNLKEISKY
ncbi:DUF5702 domain-containing protein [Anaerostipes sp.]|uniref:DUF5702 domain-containing protein n=1 Tax=Anaerostipes sp. TaxID=1872530 RepID=UPI0025BAE343|nr:DUF5702 domain-containing protein [Anaerostipes sp.]MBS7008953.1 hypothetical protein [Anaerostipes sp.]